MEGSIDDLEMARRRMGAQIQTLRDEMERQFKRTMTQIVETHENDRKNNFERYLTRASLEYAPEVFERLKSWIRCQFPSYISGFHYSQGGCFSINFTNNPPPGAWEPTMVDMNEIFDQRALPAVNAQREMAKLASSPPSDGRANTPGRTPLPADRRSSPRSKPPRQKKSAVLHSSRVEKSQTLGRIPPETSAKSKRSTKKSRQRVGGDVIKTSVATKAIPENPSWAFSYNLGEGPRYYILLCPTPGCQFSFSMHPFRNNLAVEHFQECKVSFSDEADIVRRYARQLQPQKLCQANNEVGKAWVAKYNKEVSRERARRRPRERGSASKSPVIVDEFSTESSETPPSDTELMQGNGTGQVLSTPTVLQSEQ